MVSTRIVYDTLSWRRSTVLIYPLQLALTHVGHEAMICPTCRYNDPPGFVRNGAALEPCPDCAGTIVAHCCEADGAQSSGGQDSEAHAADEARYQQLAAERPEEGGDETLHGCSLIAGLAATRLEFDAHLIDASPRT